MPKGIAYRITWEKKDGSEHGTIPDLWAKYEAMARVLELLQEHGDPDKTFDSEIVKIS